MPVDLLGFAIKRFDPVEIALPFADHGEVVEAGGQTALVAYCAIKRGGLFGGCGGFGRFAGGQQAGGQGVGRLGAANRVVEFGKEPGRFAGVRHRFFGLPQETTRLGLLQ